MLRWRQSSGRGRAQPECLCREASSCHHLRGSGGLSEVQTQLSTRSGSDKPRSMEPSRRPLKFNWRKSSQWQIQLQFNPLRRFPTSWGLTTNLTGKPWSLNSSQPLACSCVALCSRLLQLMVASSRSPSAGLRLLHTASCSMHQWTLQRPFPVELSLAPWPELDHSVAQRSSSEAEPMKPCLPSSSGLIGIFTEGPIAPVTLLAAREGRARYR